MQAAAPYPTSAEHVYYYRPYRRYRRFRYRWFWLGYSIIGIYNLANGIVTHSWSNVILGICFLALVPLTMKSWRSIRLVITPNGIVYHSGGAVLNVSWQDMEYIGRSTQHGWYRGWEGIILRRAEWKRPLPWPMRWYPQFIPLWSRQNGPWWDRELFDDLFFYAPWLAGEDRNGTVSR